MKRSTFLGLSGVTAAAVGLMAMLSPATLLAGKGVVPTVATCLWLREVGVFLLALAFLNLMVRTHPDSATLRVILLCNALVHVGLFPLEPLALQAGTITKASGILPNSILHVVLATASVAFAWQRPGRVQNK